MHDVTTPSPSLPPYAGLAISFHELRYMGFVNWYAFFKEDIRVRGKTAILGHNGAGKSAILDGVQTVLTGNDRSRLRLNASVQNEEIAKLTKSRRTVKDYCLGAIDDVESEDEGGSTTTYLRDQAITYLLLGFRRTDTGREVTLGVCLEAHREMARENPIALFIVEGRILTTDDVADSGTDANGSTWVEARRWEEVRVKIEADEALTLHVPTGPELFVVELCHIAGPEFGKMDKNKFLKNLRNAVTFKAVHSATDFVRNFILDNVPVSVAEMRASIARYAEIEKKVAETKERLVAVDGLAVRVRDIRSRWATLARRRLTSLRGHMHLSFAELADLRRRHDTTTQDLESTVSQLCALETRQSDVGTRLRQLELAHAADEKTLALERLTIEIDKVKVRMTGWQTGPVVATANRLADQIKNSLPFIDALVPERAEDIEHALRSRISNL